MPAFSRHRASTRGLIAAPWTPASRLPCSRGSNQRITILQKVECPDFLELPRTVGFADDWKANHNAHKPAGSDVGDRKGIVATTYAMLTFHEFLAKKAVVYPDLFRIQPFVGRAQPIPLKPTPKPRHRLGGGEKRCGERLKVVNATNIIHTIFGEVVTRLPNSETQEGSSSMPSVTTLHMHFTHMTERTFLVVSAY